MMEEQYEDLIPVKGHSNLGRNAESNAIINMDNTGYEAYLLAREESQRKDSDLESLKTEVEELKGILKNLISQLDK
tara:strand:- start:1518 stop:1745 length:228 start_codon:yes stop_codon:yes gene_type:complete